jgi:hypothetical protein
VLHTKRAEILLIYGISKFSAEVKNSECVGAHPKLNPRKFPRKKQFPLFFK